MVTRTITFVVGEFYHVYNRGIDKRTVYESPNDYQRFLELLYLANCNKGINVRDARKTLDNIFTFDRGEQIVAIGAYCLMPNHFHLLVTPLVERGLSTFMNKLGTGYTMYFNKRNQRTGSLFGSMFKAQHADTDQYLKYLYAYIHLNPLKLYPKTEDKTGSLQNLLSYQYSSLSDYVGSVRPEGAVLDSSFFPEYFATDKDHVEELWFWLAEYQEQTLSRGEP